MAARQHDAAMIDFGGWPAGPIAFRQDRSIDQCSAAGGAPVGRDSLCEHGVTLAANSLHTQKLTGSAGISRTGSEQP